MKELDKLKKKIKQPCPDCGNKIMEIRVVAKEGIEDGEDVMILEDYLYCPRCEYEEVVPKRKRRKEDA